MLMLASPDMPRPSQIKSVEEWLGPHYPLDIEPCGFGCGTAGSSVCLLDASVVASQESCGNFSVIRNRTAA